MGNVWEWDDRNPAAAAWGRTGQERADSRRCCQRVNRSVAAADDDGMDEVLENDADRADGVVIGRDRDSR